MDPSAASRSPKDLARAFMEHLALSDEARADRLERAADPAYWQQLNPQLTVCGQGAGLTEMAPLSDRTLSSIQAHCATEGYLEVPALFSPADMIRLRDAVEQLRAAGWPPAFLFVYDEAWALARTPSMQKVLTNTLGVGYRENTLVWCFYVANQSGASGWAPHRDGDAASTRLTLWFPLTDATLDNGCMYLVPKPALPSAFGDPSTTSISLADVATTLRATRAIPAVTGSVLGWSGDVLHWSAISKAATHPRISVALEFLSASSATAESDRPLIDPIERPPGLGFRLFVIGKCVRHYLRFEPWHAPFRGVAEGLIEIYRPPGAGTT